jgi:hypothetical protein
LLSIEGTSCAATAATNVYHFSLAAQGRKIAPAFGRGAGERRRAAPRRPSFRRCGAKIALAEAGAILTRP